MLKGIKKLSLMLILGTLLLLSISFEKEAFAIKPYITDVVVWNSGGDTILNVTVYHTPETEPHHVYQIEVKVDGSPTSFPVEVQPTTTFTIPCNLGPVVGTPPANVRTRCTLNGWSEVYGPTVIPEFSITTLLLTLAIVSLLAVFSIRRVKF